MLHRDVHCAEPHYVFIARRLDANKIQKDKLNLQQQFTTYKPVATDLGVVLDNQLTMGPQVTAVTRSCFYLLMRQLRVVQRSLTNDALKFEVIGTSIHALSVGLLQ